MTNVSASAFERVGGPLDDVCRQVLAATAQLLGTTIRFSEDDWAAPSALPGWTRAHVAAHLADHARSLRGAVIEATNHGDQDEASQQGPAEATAALGPVELQIALDTTAGELATAMHDVSRRDLELPVALASGLVVPLRLVPLVRLSEVVLHHCDLLDGYSLDEVDHQAIAWCLELRATLLIGRRDYPAVRLITPDGLDITIGRPGVPEIARGDARTLLGWLTGRATPRPGHSLPNMPLR